MPPPALAPGLTGAAGPDPAPGPRLARLGPALAALATFALHAACWGRYGIFRDELYFIACGERLAPGYVDQPPGIALVARLAHALFGTWVPGIRLLAWLAGAVTVYLAGRLAWELSRSAAGATIAAIATSSCLLLLGVAHALSMNAFEPLLVVGLVLVLLRLARGGDPRLWVAAAGLAGLAVLFKYTAAPLALALVLGFAVSPARRALRTWWTLAGAAFGVLVVLPNLAWQASHGFPFLELVRNGVLYKNTPSTPLAFLGGLLVEANPGNAPIWLGGLLWLLLGRGSRDARFAGLGALVQLLALTFGHAKPYYAAALLPVLLGAGGAALAILVRSRWIRRVYCGVLGASALFLSPLAVPILPPEALLAYDRHVPVRPTKTERSPDGVLQDQKYADQFGWPELAAGVARVYRSLPPAEREHAAVFAFNYGVAAAVDILGPQYGLPRDIAFSGHNQYWFWGIPPGRGDPVIVVGRGNTSCAGLFREQVLGEQLPSVPYALPFDDGHTLWICRGALHPSATLPPQLRHFE